MKILLIAAAAAASLFAASSASHAESPASVEARYDYLIQEWMLTSSDQAARSGTHITTDTLSAKAMCGVWLKGHSQRILLRVAVAARYLDASPWYGIIRMIDAAAPPESEARLNRSCKAVMIQTTPTTTIF